MRLKTSLLPILLLSISTLFIQGCSKEKEQQEVQTTKTTQHTNEYTLQTLHNTQLILEKKEDGFILKNKPHAILLIDVFATWCPPCQASASHLSSLQKKYKDAIKIIGVSIEDGIPVENLQTFQKQHHANYTLVHTSDTRKLINDIAQKLHIGNNFGIPLLAIYKDGKLLHYYQGMIEEEFIESDIKQALGKQ